MKMQEWKQHIAKLNKPGFYLVLAVCAGIAVNGMIVSYKLLKPLRERLEYNAKFIQMERQLSAIEASPVPAKPSDRDIEALVKQVPTKEEISRFIVSLRELEQQSGMTLASIRFGDEKSKTESDDSNAVNGQLKMNLPNANVGQNGASGNAALSGTAPSSNPSQPASNAAAAAGAFQETKVTVTGTGTYAQAVDFFNKAYQLERMTTVTDWQIDPTGKTAKAAGSEEPGEPLIQLRLTLVIYYAGQYAGLFPDLPALPVNSFEPKQSPVIADDLFLKMLDASVQKH